MDCCTCQNNQRLTDSLSCHQFYLPPESRSSFFTLFPERPEQCFGHWTLIGWSVENSWLIHDSLDSTEEKRKIRRSIPDVWR